MSHSASGSAGEIYPPRGRHPYYIVAPPYARTSAGIKVLHLLCHSLNKVGELAFVTTESVEPTLLTPVLTSAIVDEHFKRGLTPIVLYPELIFGNPLGGPVVVRYLLNYPGSISGPKEYAATDLCFGYSAELAQTQRPEFHDNVLFMPASDTSIFNTDGAAERSGTCFYAGKYRDVYGGELFETTNGSTEIYGSLNKTHVPQPTEEVAHLFKTSELFYCYENTALATEAILCGCPAVVLPNQFLTGKIGESLLGNDGVAWGDSPEQIAHAKATVGLFRARYASLVQGFWGQLDRFIAVTQASARSTPYRTKVSFDGAQTDLAAPPRSKVGKVVALVLTIVRLVQVEGFSNLVRRALDEWSREGSKGIKRLLKSAYFEHRRWIRSKVD